MPADLPFIEQYPLDPKAKKRARDYARYHNNRELRLQERRAYVRKNKAKAYAAAKKFLAENPEKRREYIRASQTKRRYGVNREQHRAMFEAQEFRCAICKIHQSEVKRRFCIDHDHVTGKVRALLCHHCNSMIGQARDIPERLRAAAEYLERHKNG